MVNLTETSATEARNDEIEQDGSGSEDEGWDGEKCINTSDFGGGRGVKSVASVFSPSPPSTPGEQTYQHLSLPPPTTIPPSNNHSSAIMGFFSK